MDDLKTADFRI